MPIEADARADLNDIEYGWRVFAGYHNDSGYPARRQSSSLSRGMKDGRKPDGPSQSSVSHLNVHSSWLNKVDEAIRKSSHFLLNTQHSEGYWWAELEANVTITSEYIMLFHLLGCYDCERERRMVKHLLVQQRPNGGWGLYYGDEGDLSTTIEAYFALKLAGHDPKSEPLRKARDFILARGGIESARVFTKIWLALFGQYHWDKIPSMPVELVLLPPDLYFNIYEFSSWARSTVVPLSIVMAMRPVLELPAEKSVPELYLTSDDTVSPHASPSKLYNIFFLIDRCVKWMERHHPVPSIRRRALKEAERWVLEHQEESGDWGGIQPCMMNSILALHFLGYPKDHPAIAKGLDALENFCLEDDEGLRLQSCISPVWDTALNILALTDAGTAPEHPALLKAEAWLKKNQITSTTGDWYFKNCCPPGGWAFEFENSQYPDVDDSAVVLMALHRIAPSECNGSGSCFRKGLEWCLNMQSESGGWAAFDKDNTLTILNEIPFADHEAMVDFPTADITGRMLELMGVFGFDLSHPRAKRGLDFIKETQETDGSWWGRWGVNYIYGTWSVMRGLMKIGENPQKPYIRTAVRWIKEHQNQDGGWGETCESYIRPELRGQGPSTPSQTAWALMSLLIADEEESPEVQRGIAYLLRNQEHDGSWEEAYFTGTGFPKHFYIRYHNYRNCFPLMALGQYRGKLAKIKS